MKAKSFEQEIAVAGVVDNRTDASFERETVIVFSDGEPIVYVSTTRRSDITTLLRNPLFKVTSDTPASNGNQRVLMGELPFGAISFRKSIKGIKAEKKVVVSKRTMPASAARCSGHKADGSQCGSLASKETGRCARHPLAVAV